jgi:hypothetical protein
MQLGTRGIRVVLYAKAKDEAIREYRTIAESKPLTLQNSDYAHAVHEFIAVAG